MRTQYVIKHDDQRQNMMKRKEKPTMFNVQLEEQETIIHFMRNDGYATIYTTDRTTMTKLDKLCEQSPEFYKLTKEDAIKGEVCGKTYRLTDKTLVSFRSKKKEVRFTDEQREASRQRMLNMRKSV